MSPLTQAGIGLSVEPSLFAIVPQKTLAGPSWDLLFVSLFLLIDFYIKIVAIASNESLAWTSSSKF